MNDETKFTIIGAATVLGAFLLVGWFLFPTNANREEWWQKSCEQAKARLVRNERCVAQENCLIDSRDMYFVMQAEEKVAACKLGYQPE